MARLFRLAKHHGVEPDLIEFSIQMYTLDLSASVNDKLQVILSRGSKTWAGAIVSATSKDGHWQFQFNSAIQVTSSMFPSKKGPRKYDAKNAKLVFKRITKNSAKTFGEIELDLAEFCDADNRGRISRVLQKCSDKQARADFSVATSLSQKEVNPSMIDDESMAMSPECSQIESELENASASLPASSNANPTSFKQSKDNWEPYSLKKPEGKHQSKPDGNVNGKQEAQSVQLLIALKDDNISRLRKKVEELELVNKTSMSLVTRVNELEDQLNKKAQAYDQLKLNSMAVEKLLEEANSKILEFAKENDESDNDTVKDNLPDQANGDMSVLALNETISELSKEKSQLMRDIAIMKLDMTSREQSYRQELGDLKQELNQAKTEKTDTSIKQKMNKETELIEALELEKVSCESLKGIIRVLQDKSAEQEQSLLKMNDFNEQAIVKLNEKIAALERTQDSLILESTALKSKNLSLLDELDQSKQISCELLKENEEFKRSSAAAMQSHQRQLLEKDVALEKSTQEINERRGVHFDQLYAFCNQFEIIAKELASSQQFSSEFQKQSSSFTNLLSEIGSIVAKYSTRERIQEDLYVLLQEKIRAQDNFISSLRQSHSEEILSSRQKLSTLKQVHKVQIEQHSSRIREYERLISASQNDNFQQVHELQNQVQSLLYDKAQVLLEFDRLCATTKESKQDVKDLLLLLSLRDKVISGNVMEDRDEGLSFEFSDYYKQQSDAFQLLFTREMDRFDTQYKRLNRFIKSAAKKNLMFEEALHESSKQQQKFEAELLHLQEQNSNAESTIEMLQQKLRLMENLTVSMKTELAKVMMKYETVCHERDCITRDLISSKIQYANLHKKSTDKILLMDALVKASIHFEDAEVNLVLDALSTAQEQSEKRFELADCVLRNAATWLAALNRELVAKSSDLETTNSKLVSMRSNLEQLTEILVSSQNKLTSTTEELKQISIVLESCHQEINALKADATIKDDRLLQAKVLMSLFEKDRKIHLENIQDLYADIASLKTIIFELQSMERTTLSYAQSKQLQTLIYIYELESARDHEDVRQQHFNAVLASTIEGNNQIRRKLLNEKANKADLETSNSKIAMQLAMVAQSEGRIFQILQQNINLYHLNEELILSLRASAETLCSIEQQARSYMMVVSDLQTDHAKLKKHVLALMYEYERLLYIHDDDLTRKLQSIKVYIVRENAEFRVKDSKLETTQRRLMEYEKRNEALSHVGNDTKDAFEKQITALLLESETNSSQYKARIEQMKSSVQRNACQQELQSKLHHHIAVTQNSEHSLVDLKVELDKRE